MACNIPESGKVDSRWTVSLRGPSSDGTQAISNSIVRADNPAEDLLRLTTAYLNRIATAVSVEFYFPMEALRRYEAYDCTGQQLIDSGIVLINGERAGLDLELAQGSGQR